MFDRVLGETAEDPPAGDGWREAFTAVAHERWRMGERHPWMLDLAMHRPPLGPNLVRRHERSLALLDGTGLDDLTKDMVIDVLHNYLAGALKQARDAREAEQLSGLTDEQWFAMAEPAITARLDPTAFPHLRRLGDAWKAADKAAVADPFRRFQFGLEVVLDGIATLIAAKRAAA